MSCIRPRSRRRRPPWRSPWAVAAGLGAIAAIVTVSLLAAPDGSTDGGVDPVVATGEQNSMGMPVIATPGAASATATAGSVEVAGAAWELGRVPLNVAVRPHWLLRNTGADAVTVGEPHAEVRAGCCPGAFALDTTTIPPGGEAMLRFELSMHPGMDGWHDFAVHVPIEGGGSRDLLTLSVTGDFRSS